MKVLFIARATLFSVKGGDTTQVYKTAEYLRKSGVEVDTKLSSDIINYEEYDLLHFFNIIRPADILKHIAKSNKPFVISTIYCDYDEYDKKARGGIVGFLRKFFSADSLEYFKVIARYFMNGERINSQKYLLWGHKKAVRQLIQKSNMLLPNSENEYKRLTMHFKATNRYKVIVNGIDHNALSSHISLESVERVGLLCVAQIEGRKNQINLIKAVNELGYPLIILGKSPPNFTWYADVCKTLASKNITFIDRVSEEELIELYSKAKVHVLPSWFETTGLVSLEAATMGCNIVITAKGDTKEYFGDDAFYCEPDNVDSIKNAIKNAYNSPVNENLKTRIINNFTWQKAADQTLAAYKEVLAII